MTIKILKNYKQTDVGVLPVDWEVYNLYKISERITDGEHATPKRVNSGYYLLSARNVHDGRIDLTDVDFVDLEEYQRIRKRCNPETGDVLISCSGTIGRVAVLPPGIECVMVRSAALIKPDRAKTNSYFIQYVLQSIVGQTQIAKSLNQGAQANLFINHIEKLQIPFPPLPEQKAIAQALSDADAAIAKLDRLITKKRNIKQGGMQQLLMGKKRLAGFGEGQGYKQTEIGVIPIDWEVKKLALIADIKTGPFGSALHEKDYVEYGVPIITVEHLGELGVVHQNLPRVSGSDKKRLSAYILQTGDIVFSRVGSVDRSSLISEVENGWLFSSRLLRVRLNNQKVWSAYLNYNFHQEPTKQRIRSVAVGQTMASLNTEILKNIEVILPPTIEEQKAIAQILTDMDTEIEALEQKRDKYKAIKQGMMQELLTGKTRLVNNE